MQLNRTDDLDDAERHNEDAHKPRHDAREDDRVQQQHDADDDVEDRIHDHPGRRRGEQVPLQAHIAHKVEDAAHEKPSAQYRRDRRQRKPGKRGDENREEHEERTSDDKPPIVTFRFCHNDRPPLISMRAAPQSMRSALM